MSQRPRRVDEEFSPAHDEHRRRQQKHPNRSQRHGLDKVRQQNDCQRWHRGPSEFSELKRLGRNRRRQIDRIGQSARAISERFDRTGHVGQRCVRVLNPRFVRRQIHGDLENAGQFANRSLNPSDATGTVHPLDAISRRVCHRRCGILEKKRCDPLRLSDSDHAASPIWRQQSDSCGVRLQVTRSREFVGVRR